MTVYPLKKAQLRINPVVIAVLFAISLFFSLSFSFYSSFFSTHLAFAATKVLDIKRQNIVFTIDGPIDTVCGTASTEKLIVRQFHLEEFDNHHVVISQTLSARLYDSEGKLIGESTARDITVSGNQGLPLHQGVSFTGTCTGASDNPGHPFKFHFSQTIGKDGTIHISK